MPAWTRWAELVEPYHRIRWDWADHAYNAFVDGLLPEIQAALPRSRKDTNVILYGKSQIGKSTLALALLGVRSGAFAEIDHVLRGGRPVGKSATVAPTRYTVAEDDNWWWRSGLTGPWQVVSGPELRSTLQDVRETMQTSGWDPAHVLHIAIPRRYVADDDGRTLRVLDLPGTEPRDRTERRYVKRLLPGWIEAADIVLLVGAAAQLGFLSPADIGVDGLRKWHQVTERFRVVLLRFYTDQQLLKQIAKRPHWASPQTMREYVLGMRRNKDIPRPAAPPDTWLYPLEFGTTWDVQLHLRGVPEAARAAATRCRDAVLDQLRTELREANRPERRIRGAYRAAGIAEDVRTELELRLDQRTDRVQAALTHARTVDDRRRELAARTAAELDARRTLLGRLDGMAAAARAVPGDVDVGPVDRLARDGLHRELERRFVDTWAHWRATAPAELLPLPDRPPHDAYSDERCRARARELVERRMPVLVRTVGTQRHVGRVRERLARRAAEAAADLTALLRERIQADLDEVGERLRREMDALAARLQDLHGRVDAAEQDVVEAVGRAAHNDHAVERERARLAAAVDDARGFPAVLAAHFAAHRRRLTDDVARFRDPTERLVAALAVLDRAQVYDTIRQGR